MNNPENLETIENYVNDQLSADERMRFETALRTDPAVADALKFYVVAKETARQQARQAHEEREQRRAELDALRRSHSPKTFADMPTDTRPRPTWSAPVRWAAAASVVLLMGLGWVFLRGAGGGTDAVQMADAYVTTNYGQLSTAMSGGPADRLKQGVELYNRQQFAEAEPVFAQLLTEQPDNDRALKYAGLVAYRLKNYDQAVERFSRLNRRTDLLDTSGPFLEALARIQRNQPIDKEPVKNLLQRVIRENLEGKAEAKELIKTYEP